MPVDAIKIPDYIYGKRLDDKQKQILASGGQLPINDIQRCLLYTSYEAFLLDDENAQDDIFQQNMESQEDYEKAVGQLQNLKEVYEMCIRDRVP